MNLTVPSLAPGARTLPIGLRDHHVDRNGWARLRGNMAPLTEHPINIDPRIALSGVGEFCDDSGICYPDVTGGTYLDPSTFDVGQIPTESPYPVVLTTADPSGNVTSQSMTPAQLTALINAGSISLQRILAITQGGSVLANGSIIGSQQAAQLAAAQSGLSITSQGLTGLLSSPMVPIAIMSIVAALLLKGR